jgi:dihydroorotase
MRNRIINCDILDPVAGERFRGFVEWEDGIIRQVGRDLPNDDAAGPEVNVVDGGGHLLAPSFVDLYAEFCEPGAEYREDIASGSAAAAAGGFTTVLLRPDTDPCVDGADTVRFVLEQAARVDRLDLLPMGCLSRKLGGETMAEIGEMAMAGVVALCEGDRWVGNTGFLRRAMEYARNFDLPVVLTSEDPTLVDGKVHEGIVSAAKGLKTSPVAAEEIALARHVALAELTGTRTHLAKISSAAGVRLVREAKARGLPVTASVSIHNLVLDETSIADYDPMAKVWPPARAEADRKALLAAVADGTLDAVVSDHAPRAIEDKEVEFDLASTGAASIELVFTLLNRLILAGELDLVPAIRALTVGSRRVLGLPGGSIAVGMPADLVLLDRSTSWVVEPERLASRGCNTPFAGTRQVGRPVMTLRRGTVTFQRTNT